MTASLCTGVVIGGPTLIVVVVTGSTIQLTPRNNAIGQLGKSAAAMEGAYSAEELWIRARVGRMGLWP